MTFIAALFPLELSAKPKITISRKTSVMVSIAGHEERLSRIAHSKRVYEISYSLDKLHRFESVTAFFENVHENNASFLFNDVSDYKSTRSMRNTISANDCLLGLGNNTTTSFQIVKPYEYDGFVYNRKIRRIVPGSLLVALNNVVQLSGYSESGGVITFATAPASGVEITAGFAYHVEVRFVTDTLTRTLPIPELFEFGNIKLEEIK
jgi:uncharacterized protein (TIGR02217 family)